MNKETKQESSIPVATRVSVVTLAELDKYWVEGEGKYIKSMSQLVSWSLELLTEVLRANGKIESIESVAEAHRRLMGRELYQPSLSKRSFNKIGTAIKFENLRLEGIDPKKDFGEGSNVTRAYNMLHNSKSVQPLSRKGYSELTKKAIEIYDSKWGVQPKETIDINKNVDVNIDSVKEGMSEEEAVQTIKSLDEQWKREKEEMDKILGINSTGDEVSE